MKYIRRNTLRVKMKSLGLLNSTVLIMLTGISLGFNVQANLSKAVDKNTLSLQNLERERAALVQDILNPSYDVQTRLQQLQKRQRHLTDMERMVMRDERLMTSSSSFVKKAFDNYESTFLVHAGAEQNRSASQQWLATINITNKAILNTQIGYRK